MAEHDLRQRASKVSSSQNGRPASNAQDVSNTMHESTSVISIMDVLRIVFTLCAASCAMSYYLTSGESILWGHRPWISRPDLLRAYFQGPLRLTTSELSRYNGSDKDLPVYLAINGTIFDVSAGRRTYGPGGSYSNFAGRDATRAFVTGCFQEDLTNDMRGAELMYIPVDDEDDVLTSGERKKRAEQEKREAKRKVQQEVKKWEDFYRNSKKYFAVGELIEKPIYEGPPLELCEGAAKSRPKRKNRKNDGPVPTGKPV